MGRGWNHEVSLREFITNETSLVHNAREIFKVLDNDSHFLAFTAKWEFRDFPDDGTTDNFDDILCSLYDYCDDHRIWIKL